METIPYSRVLARVASAVVARCGAAEVLGQKCVLNTALGSPRVKLVLRMVPRAGGRPQAIAA